jgi:crotonobetainyl-CoA:carnitine CoA-transferase CaiB-like acyl-CoA transferase
MTPNLLSNVRVLDLSRLLPGPYLTMMLGDFGADVVKIEDPGVGDYLRGALDAQNHGGVSSLYQWINRNKRGVIVDLKSDAGRELIYRLAADCDVVVEGARPGASARLGVGYDDICAVNPKIVYCSVSGFGQTGPFTHLASHGGAYDAVTGLAVPYEFEDGTFVQHRPYPHALVYGSWLGAAAVCAALVRARDTGEGSYLDISCADATVMALGQELVDVMNNGAGWPPPPEDDIEVRYSYYRTKDDRFMLIQAVERHFWEAFCDAADRPDLKARGDWSQGRMEFGVDDLELRHELQQLFRSKTQAEWTDLFLEKNIAGAPYYPVTELSEVDVFREREMFRTQPNPETGEPFRTVGNAVRVDGASLPIERTAPRPGQHSVEVLGEFGLTAAEIADLQSAGVVV